MKEADFIERLSKKGYTKHDAKIIIDDFTRVVMESLADGEEVKLHGFGTFSIKDVKEHEMVQVHTKERIIVPGYKIPKFTAGVQFKRAVKEGLIRE